MFRNIKNFIKKPETVVLVLSVCFTLLVSGVVGLCTYFILDNFVAPFVLATILQLVVFAVVNTRQIKKDEVELAKIYNERLQVLSRLTVRLSCAYCKVPAQVPVQLNTENRFKCESCNQINGIKMQFFTTQITTPLDKIVLPIDEETTTEINFS